MTTRIGDVVAGSGAALMAVALGGMVLELVAGAVPGTPWMMALSLGLVAVVAALVWRFEQAAAQHAGSAASLQEIRARRAELVLREQIDQGTAPALIAA